jgi:hypothetical protein
MRHQISQQTGDFDGRDGAPARGTRLIRNPATTPAITMTFVNDVPPEGSNGAGNSTALHTNDGRFGGFLMPSSSGFVYKWEAGG